MPQIKHIAIATNDAAKRQSSILKCSAYVR